MNIQSTSPRIQAPKANNGAITISVPSLSSEKVADGTWNVLDSVEKFAGRTGQALMIGAGGALPLVGYNLSKHIRRDFAVYGSYTNSVNELSNAAMGVAQMGGMAVGAVAAVSGLAGYSGAETLGWVAGGLFGVAGLSGMMTAYSTENLKDLTKDFGS